jgi:putative peptidoglycan lipid II flippase
VSKTPEVPETANPPVTASSGKTTGLFRSSLIFSGLTLVSRFMGLARDLAITARLGASLGPAADAYNTALAFPNLFRRIFAEGAFAAAFVPSYARTLESEGEAAADKLATEAMASLAFLTICVTLIAQLTMPWLMMAMNPGYLGDPAKFKLAVVLTQVSMPYLPFMALVALLSGILNARGKFILSALAPTLLNAAMLAAVLPQHDPVRAATAASWGVIAAGALQFGLLWWGCRRSRVSLQIRLPRFTPAVKTLIGLAVPGAIAASVTQINIFVSGILASQVNGARSWLAVADRFYQLPLGLVGVAIGVALLPRLSRAVQAGATDEARDATDQAIVMAMALTLPAAAALSAIPFYLIDALFARGAFSSTDAHQTAAALFHYGWGVPAFVLARILSPVFFARGDTKAPMRFALVSVALNIGLGLVLFYLIGFAGIAAATAFASWANVGQMTMGLWKSKTYRIRPHVIARLGKLLLASLLLGAILALGEHFRTFLESLIPLRHGSKEVTVLLLVAVGALCYPFLVLATGGVSLTDVRSALVRRGPATLPASNPSD